MSQFPHHVSCKLNSLCRLFSKVVSIDQHDHQGGNIEDDWEYIEVLDRELLSDEDKESSIYSQDIVMLDQASTSLEHPYHVKMKYTVLSKDHVRQRLEDKITKVCNVFLLPRNEAAILLQHFKWSVSRTNDEWLASEEKVRRAVGLFERPVTETPNDAAEGRTCWIACSICHGNFQRSTMSSVSCGHQICHPCWKAYIREAVNDGPRCLTLRCPKASCDAAVGFQLIAMLSSQDDKMKFENHLLGSYITNRRKAKWCPAPNCNYIVFSPNGGEGNVTCRCSHCFCWKCSAEGHAPVDCNTLVEWMSEGARQSENWVLANTVSCPRCNVKFESEQDFYKYIKCTSCKLAFCCDCGGNWFNYESNGYWIHKCKFDLDFNLKQSAKNSLERYNYHYGEWAVCESSRVNTLVDLCMFRNTQLEFLRAILCLSPKDLDFFVEALEQIAECWQILKWMHVYGYFLDDNEHVKKHLFEFMQGEAISLVKRLQMHAEDLQYFLSGEAPLKKFIEYKSNMTVLTRVTRNYFDQLVEGLVSGLSEAVCISELSPRLKKWHERGEKSFIWKSPNSNPSPNLNPSPSTSPPKFTIG
ncbi:probable E3 ubiquitin-protein ligase ARI8 isoform X1 [Amaranthus tricolor]|uniref:probable E3 ubiquitin-protein ligase ARI8 isoform X1 n=1 Tax=Amaranthus tricolor TaxID=29722 RepID=UPI00258B7D4D|nr:probable E3 ubiquitin-protein ligase ARI8 isoform X1 [Amaranthus tricolor]